jgi:hypothetical protein
MGVSAISMVDSLARISVERSESQVAGQIAISVMKQTMDQAKQQAAAILAMGEQSGGQSPSADGLGQYLDVAA